jgi:hypothetical protein
MTLPLYGKFKPETVKIGNIPCSSLHDGCALFMANMKCSMKTPSWFVNQLENFKCIYRNSQTFNLLELGRTLGNTFLESKELKRFSGHIGGRRALQSRKVPFINEELANLERMPLALFDGVFFLKWSLPFHINEPCYHFMVNTSTHFVITIRNKKLRGFLHKKVTLPPK